MYENGQSKSVEVDVQNISKDGLKLWKWTV